MATSVTCESGWGSSDGKTINAKQARRTSLSSFGVAGGASPLLNVPGVLPTGGNALGVTQAATPAMKVTVIAGRGAAPSNNAGEAPYPFTLETNTDLDIATSHVTNPRIDLVIAKVYDHGDGTSTSTIEILTGDPGAVPIRPNLPNGEYHCISLATVAVAANATTIVNANITKVESDTWTTATSDARYMTAPGGAIFKTGVATMSSTRRAAWAASYCPGMPFWDFTNKMFGVTGSDAIPLSIRKLFDEPAAATQQANTTTPVLIANSGTLTVFGGTRRVRVTMSGNMGTDRNDIAGWVAGRVFLTGAGAITIPGTCRAHARLFGNSSSAAAVSQQGFGRSWTFDVGAGTFSVSMSVLQVAQGGSGTGSNVIVTDACLLIEDIGPA